jgi:hypothetical protein
VLLLTSHVSVEFQRILHDVKTICESMYAVSKVRQRQGREFAVLMKPMLHFIKDIGEIVPTPLYQKFRTSFYTV